MNNKSNVGIAGYGNLRAIKEILGGNFMTNLEVKEMVQKQIKGLVQDLLHNGATDEQIYGAIQYANAVLVKELDEHVEWIQRTSNNPGEVIFNGTEIYTELVKSDDIK